MIYEKIEAGAVETAGVVIPGTTVIKRTDEEGNEAYIPCDEGNSDYQAYLTYLAEQETA